MKTRTGFGLFTVVFVIMLALTGCATVEKDTTMDTERLLSAAGFQMRLADTPEKLEKIKKMPQRKIFPHQRNGTTYYLYADATECECLYAGTEKAYERAKELSELRQAKIEGTSSGEDVVMDWEVWGGDPGSAWQYWK